MVAISLTFGMTVFTRLALWHRVSVVSLRSWWYVHHSRDSGPSQSSSMKWCFHCSWKLSFKPSSPFVLTNLTAPKTLSMNSFSGRVTFCYLPPEWHLSLHRFLSWFMYLHSNKQSQSISNQFCQSRQQIHSDPERNFWPKLYKLV